MGHRLWNAQHDRATGVHKHSYRKNLEKTFVNKLPQPVVESYEDKEKRETKITIDNLKKILPTGKKHLATQQFVDSFNKTLESSEIRQELRENFLGYTQVLQDGRYRIEDYLSAVKYVSYKLMGDSNVVAWSKTFPERYTSLVQKGIADRDLDSRVAMYNRNQLVNKILEQSLIPTHVLNQDIYQKAINTQAELMMTARSEKVRSDAANSLLTHLKMPETSKVQLDVNVKQDDSINELRKTTMELVSQQKRMIEAGAMTTREVAHSKIIEGEVEDITDD
jgi:hypothetical protein